MHQTWFKLGGYCKISIRDKHRWTFSLSLLPSLSLTPPLFLLSSFFWKIHVSLRVTYTIMGLICMSACACGHMIPIVFVDLTNTSKYSKLHYKHVPESNIHRKVKIDAFQASEMYSNVGSIESNIHISCLHKQIHWTKVPFESIDSKQPEELIC